DQPPIQTRGEFNLWLQDRQTTRRLDSQEQTQQATGDGERQVLGQQLSHDTTATCPKSESNGNFPVSPRAPGQLKVAKIGASVQEDYRGNAREKGHRACQTADAVGIPLAALFEEYPFSRFFLNVFLELCG